MIVDIEFEEQEQLFDMGFEEENLCIETDFGEIQKVTEYIGGEEYRGDYVAIPKTEEQVFETKGKVLLDNMTVKSIPFFNVGNTSGGSTVFIASEV